MSQDIVVRYKAEVDDLTRQLNAVIDKQEQVTKGQKEGQIQVDSNISTQEAAAKKRLQLLKLEEAELKKLQALRKLSFDPKQIAAFDAQIAKAKNNIKLLSGEVNNLGKAGSAFRTIGNSIAGTLALAFSVDVVNRFAQASISAFLDAQENADRLRFTIVQLNQESELAFERLIKQAAQLQDTTIFDDESIIQAQNLLATFNLTAEQIEDFLPLLADFASQTKQDILSAANVIGLGLKGTGRELRKFGIDVSASKSELENFNSIVEGMARFQGAAARETETLTGQLKQQANAADELQERIGEKLAPAFVKAKLAVFAFFEAVIDGFRSVDSVRAENALTARDNLKTIILTGLETESQINKQSLLENAKREQLKIGKQLNELEKEVIQSELKHNPIRLAQLEKERKILIQSAGIIKEIINDEQTRVGNKLDDTKEASDKRIAGSEKEIQLIKALSAEYRDLFTLLTDESKALLIDLSIKANLDIDQFKEAVIEEVKKMQKELTIPEKIEVPVDVQFKIDSGEIAQPEFFNLDVFLKTNDEIISAAQELFSSITALSNQYASARIADIERVKQAELDAIDIQLKQVEESLEKRRISEVEAEKQTKALLDKKVKAEKEAAEKERQIKRKQAILDKAAALIDITISTAKNIASTKIPLLIALYAAAGAAQAAVVAATPIPYKKGTKSAKGGLSLVDEEGSEAILRVKQGRLTGLDKGDKVLPAPKTKTYGEALDAMYDNRFEKYILKSYVAPALAKQKQMFEKQKQETFAENVGRHVTVNNSEVTKEIIAQFTGMTSHEFSRIFNKGVLIKNADEVGKSIAKNTPTNPYNR